VSVKNYYIDPTAEIAEGVKIGIGACIGARAVISRGVEIGPNVVIGPDTFLGEGVKVYPGAVIGTDPQDIKFDGSQTKCEIGPHTVIREYATINRGTSATGKTVIGAHSYLMAYVHVAHDCRVGDHVVLANNSTLAGHCEIEDHAVLGGYVAVHQFVRVGTLAMVGGFSGLRKDAPPYMLTVGYPPALVYGLNLVGLKRAGMSPKARAVLKEAFRILYRSGLNFSDALKKIENELERTEEIEHLLEFFAKSKRGVSRGSMSRRWMHEEIEHEDEFNDLSRTVTDRRKSC